MFTICQQTFAEQFGDEYRLKHDKDFPLTVDMRPEEFEEDGAPGDKPFRKLVGCLLYLSTQSRPDISNAVRAKAMQHPKRAKQGSMPFCGVIFRRSQCSARAYWPFETQNTPVQQPTVTGGVVLCGGAAVSWLSRTYEVRDTINDGGRVRGTFRRS